MQDTLDLLLAVLTRVSFGINGVLAGSSHVIAAQRAKLAKTEAALRDAEKRLEEANAAASREKLEREDGKKNLYAWRLPDIHASQAANIRAAELKRELDEMTTMYHAAVMSVEAATRRSVSPALTQNGDWYNYTSDQHGADAEGKVFIVDAEATVEGYASDEGADASHDTPSESPPSPSALPTAPTPTVSNNGQMSPTAPQHAPVVDSSDATRAPDNPRATTTSSTARRSTVGRVSSSPAREFPVLEHRGVTPGRSMARTEPEQQQPGPAFQPVRMWMPSQSSST